jgi:chromosomal replication initiator protein
MVSVHDMPARITFLRRNKPAQDIIREVAAKHELDVSDLLGPSKRRKYAWPRQEAMMRMREETELSYPQIARLLRREDHTTILYGVRAARQRIKEGN